MSEIEYINYLATSDTAWIKIMGNFIRYNRLQQNKTQSQLAEEAGIVRSTLSLFERGENTSLIVFIQLLRALKLLYLLKEFQVRQQISPVQLAKLEISKRVRAGRKGRQDEKSKSEW